jgi:hypothetical protein
MIFLTDNPLVAYPLVTKLAGTRRFMLLVIMFRQFLQTGEGIDSDSSGPIF